MYSVLIDYSNKEDFRAVLLDKDNSVLRFSFELSSKRQLKGNIYMARVVRVESSLQAVFVDYGGDKLGFLPFSEIHPCYYQLPNSEKDVLLTDDSDSLSIGDCVEDKSLGSCIFDAYKKYKLQDVIKEGQMLLIQVIKEARGTKGVYMSSFIGMSGKCSVLLPNTPGKKCLSKSIVDTAARESLNNILKRISLLSGSSIILRSSAVNSSESQILSDLNYLAFLWDSIKKAASKNKEPAIIYDSGNILKRTLRDFPLDKVKEIVVDGQDTMVQVQDFLKMLSEGIPSHISLNVYEGVLPIFSYYRIENYLESLFSNVVQLRQSGYLVISITEALISIDVNSGSALSHNDVENTAIAINKDAAFEIARQVQLRSLSGLIVIDFIDMMSAKNRKTLENTVKKAFAEDSAKLQFSELSQFGLLEMSRQRVSPSIAEVYDVTCSSCKGIGSVRSIDKLSVDMFRSAVNHLNKYENPSDIEIKANKEIIIFVLNYKRDMLQNIESSFSIKIFLRANAEDSDYSVNIIDLFPVVLKANAKKTRETSRDKLKTRASDKVKVDKVEKVTEKVKVNVVLGDSWVNKFFESIL